MTPDDEEFWEELHTRRRRTRPDRDQHVRSSSGPDEPHPDERRPDESLPRAGAAVTEVAPHEPSRSIDRIRRGGGRRDTRLVIAVAATAAVWTVVMLVRLLAGGGVGLADQGEFRQLVCTFNVAPDKPWNADTRSYVYPTYHHEQWWGESCGLAGSGQPYNSSERWLLGAAKSLTAPLGFPGALDLRALGVLCSVLVGLGVGAWVAVLPGGIGHRVAVASLIGLVYADSLIAPWFVSAYSEPAAMLGLLFLGPALLWLWKRRRSTVPRLVLVGALALFTATATSQAVALVPPLLLGLLWNPSRGWRTRPGPSTGDERVEDEIEPRVRRRWGPRLLAFARARPAALVVAAVLVVGAGMFVGAQPARTATAQKYDAFFGELLPHSPNPKGDLKAFGLPASLLSANGTALSSDDAATRTPEFDVWNQKVTMPKIWLAYVRDPVRLVGLGTRGMHAVAQGRPTYLANYGERNGAPYSLEHRVPVFLTVFHLLDKALPLLAAVWLVTLLWGWATAKDAKLTDTERGIGRLAVVVVLMITLEFWVTALTDGDVDFVKHMVLTDLLTALCFPILLAMGLTARRYRSHP